MKLELKHLSPYLPYGLKVKFETSGKVRIIDGLSFYNNYVYIKTEGKAPMWSQQNWDYKPILRPLSDLKNYITWGGLTFKPLETIKKDFQFYDSIKFVERDKCIELKGYAMITEIHYIDDLPYKKMEKLLMWKFDVFGLIDQDLAIDINTL